MTQAIAAAPRRRTRRAMNRNERVEGSTQSLVAQYRASLDGGNEAAISRS